ncbi:MAG: flagellar hook-length control protein FliK [Fimbriimonadaceae bacterium]
MEMTQLMGTPSVDRQTQGSLSKQSTAATSDGTVGKEFTDQLQTAITDGQKKEVNPDELIAQLVGLDLSSGILPKQLAESGTDYMFDLSVGRIGGANVDINSAKLATDLDVSQVVKGVEALGEQKLGVVGQSIKEIVSALGNAYVTNEDGRDHSNGSPAISLVDPRVSGGLAAQSTKLAESALVSAPVDLAAAIRTGVKNWIRRQTGMSESPAAISTPGLVDNADQSAADIATKTNVLVDAVPVDEAPIDRSGEAVPQVLQKETGIVSHDVIGQVAVPVLLGGALNQTSHEASTQGVVLKTPVGAKIGYRGTGQGRPDDLLTLDNGAQVKTDPATVPIPKPQIGPLTLREIKPVTVNVDSQATSVIPIDPREIAKTPASAHEVAETAPAIIEGIAGRLTRESFVVKPTVLATPQLQSETATTAVAQNVAPVVAQERLKPAREQNTAAIDSMVASDSELVPGLSSGTRTLVTSTALSKAVVGFDDMTPLRDDRVDDSLGNESDLSMKPVAMDLTGKATDAKSVSVTKTEVAKEAVDGAHQKIADAVMDLIAARRPQTIKIQLNPVELGTIDVSVRTGGGRVDVDLRASDDGVRQGLAANRADLVRTIESGGTSVSSMNVGQHLGQDAGQAGHRGGDQASREDFQHAVNLGQVSTNAETLAVTSSSYGTSGNGRVDLAA